MNAKYVIKMTTHPDIPEGMLVRISGVYQKRKDAFDEMERLLEQGDINSREYNIFYTQSHRLSASYETYMAVLYSLTGIPSIQWDQLITELNS